MGLVFFALSFALLAARAARDGVFLSSQPSSALPMVYVWSALAIALGVWVASQLARKVRPERLYPLAAAMWGALIIGARIGLDLWPWATLAPTLYVLIEAGPALLLVLLWRLLDVTFAEPRTAARLAKLAEGAATGLLLASGAWALLLLLAGRRVDRAGSGYSFQV